MITDPDGTRVISSVGWVDRGALWVFDSVSAGPNVGELSDARYLVLHGGRLGQFAVVHHWDGGRVSITAHAFSEPARELGRIDVRGWTGSLHGQEAVWDCLPRSYVSYLKEDATGSAGYFAIRRVGVDVQVSRLGWFDDGDYDHDYQGVVSITEVPELDEVIFGVQRSSTLVRCTATGTSVSGEVQLTGHLGNPVPVASRLGPSIWVTDYDTVVRLSRPGLTVESSAALSSTSMFVGDPWVPTDERYLVVARPGSGDVVILDPDDLRITESIDVGRQPLEASVLNTGQLVARDWKTGDTLLGRVAG